MGNTASLMLQPEEIEELQQETGCKSGVSLVTSNRHGNKEYRNQIVRLYSRFINLDKRARGYLDKDDFLRIPELAINPLGDRIVDAFFNESQNDDDQKVNFRQFMRVLARFRPINKNKPNQLNSRESKLKFAFNMYDMNGNGLIAREEFEVILNMMVGANITPEQLQSIADRTIAEADENGDGMISFEEFCKAMDKTDIEQKMSIRFLH